MCFSFSELQKHDLVKVLHKLNLSCSWLRNVLSWILFFLIKLLISFFFFYITFSTTYKILLLSLELNLEKTSFYEVMFLLNRARLFHMANFPVFCLVLFVVPSNGLLLLHLRNCTVGQDSLLSRNAL